MNNQHTMTHDTLTWLASMLFAASIATAQQPASPLDKATESKADAPATIIPKPKLNDAEIDRLMSALTGSFAAAAASDAPDLRMNSTAITVDGLDNAVYFEVARADAPASPFRQGVFHAFRHQKELWLRVFEFGGNPGLKDTLTGLWAAPDVMPKLSVESLIPNLDLVMSADSTNKGWQGTVPHAYATARDGAVEMTATITVTPGELRLDDAGFSADGMQVWGPRAIERPIFKKTAAAVATVKRLDGGLISITLVAPPEDAPKLVENGQVAVQYTGWLADGTRFDSSRLPNRDAFMLRVPGPVIKGWNEGLKEIAKGERRRLIIPPAMAYGERGTRDGRIPANSTLIFDVECVFLDNALPTPPPQSPPVPMNPHGMGGAPPTGGGSATGDQKPK